MTRQQMGFTLIEVMIVVVIIAVLAAIAIPSYQDQANRARRTDATEALMSIAGIQERHFLQNNGYAKVSDGVFPNHTEQNYYDIRMASALPCVSDPTAPPSRLACYIIEAVPSANSPQRQDDECATFAIDNSGRKLAYDKNGALNTNECW